MPAFDDPTESLSTPNRNRILWNVRPRADGGGGDIDEIVLFDVASVHVEQMDDRCWWIGITLADGTDWAGNFSANSRGRMTFTEQEGDVEWALDQTHEDESPFQTREAP